MKFCPQCGRPFSEKSFQGRGEALRCEQGHLSYPPGPKILVAGFIHCDDKLLWMKRANPPRAGHWAIPAGFMENGETLREAVSREVREETGVDLAPGTFAPYMIGSISFISEVYIGLRARVGSTYCKRGVEALDVGFFKEDEIDWDNVAYPSANESVKTAYREIRDQSFSIYHGSYTGELDQLTLVWSPPCAD